MNRITIQIVEGTSRGHLFESLLPPVRIGREIDNEICLQDERASRFHAKIQLDRGRLLLTDLQSTNGTFVNGSPVHLRILQPGDLITIGRSILRFGSREEIAAYRRQGAKPAGPTLPLNTGTVPSGTASGAVGAFDELDESSIETPNGPPDTSALYFLEEPPPEVPSDLAPGHAGAVSDALAHVHRRLGKVLSKPVRQDGADPYGQQAVTLSWKDWQTLADLHSYLATSLNRLATPEETE